MIGVDSSKENLDGSGENNFWLPGVTSGDWPLDLGLGVLSIQCSVLKI